MSRRLKAQGKTVCFGSFYFELQGSEIKVKLKEIYSYDNPVYKPLREPARAVTSAFSNANKWLDTVQEGIYIETGMKHTANAIHGIAHKMLAWLDVFSDLLHERHLMTEYPQTEEIDTEVRDMDATFELIVDILDSVQEGLEAFHAATDNGKFRPMCLKIEELMLLNSAEYTKVLDMWKMWDMGVGESSFDNWVLHMEDGGVE